MVKYKNDSLGNKGVIIYNKSTTILSSFVDFYANIYKGNLYRRLKITKYIVGYKFGEFTHTRKPFTFPVKKKNLKNASRL